MEGHPAPAAEVSADAGTFPTGNRSEDYKSIHFLKYPGREGCLKAYEQGS